MSGAQSEEQVSSLRGGFKSRLVICFGFRANKMSNLSREGNAWSEKHLDGQSSTPAKEIGFFSVKQHGSVLKISISFSSARSYSSQCHHARQELHF
jgi:hypothetical protein